MIRIYFLFVLAVVLLSGCTKPVDDTIRFGLSRLPVTLDPRFATDAASYRINRLIYRQLVDFDSASKPIPALASWQKLSPQHYRFTLNKNGRVFSDGSILTVEDVKATYEFVLDKANASPHRVSLALIDQMVVNSPEQIDFILSKPDALFPGRLVMGILPAKLMQAGHAFNRQPVGSGPFQLVEWDGDSELLLQRRGDGQQLGFVAVPDPTVRVLKIMRGEIDMLQNDLPPELVNYLGEQQGISVQKTAGSNFAYLGFNIEDQHTGQLEIRRAIAYALDREKIIKYVLGNAARKANAILPPDHWAGHSGLKGYDYNPELARSILQQVGIDENNPITLVYKTSSDPFRLRLATIIQQQLAEVNIKVDLRSYDWGTFYGDIKAGRFQMFSLMWVGVKLPDIFRYVFHSEAVPPDGANRGRFVDAKVDHLIDQAEVSLLLPQQASYYRALQEMLLEKLPYVPLWYEDHVFVKRDRIHGYKVARDGNYDGLIAVELVGD